ncbi:Uncharacterised protein [uncultured archaeon]|nr:Uncharacterised protein [uncultured archaeon]
MFDNIKKEDKIRYATIAVILLFIFSTIAIYMSTAANNGGGTRTPSPATNSTAGYTFTGRGVANATLTGWDPVLFVRGPDPNLLPALEQLQQAGIVTKQVPQAGGYILTLSDSRQVYNTTRGLLGLNVSIQGSGTISIPQASVTDPAGAVHTVSGGTYSYTATPAFDQGDTLPVAFDTYVEGSRMPYNPANLVVLPGPIVDAEIAALNVTINQNYWRGLLPWSQRNLALNQFQANLIGGDRLKFRQRSVVIFPRLISPAQIAQLKASPPAWSTGDVEEGLAGVKPEFSDETAVANDLISYGVTPLFPASVMEVYPNPFKYLPNSSEPLNRSNESISADIARIWNATYPDTAVEFRPAYFLTIDLPSTIETGGQTYRLLKTEYNVSSNYAPMENGTLKISFQPVGRQVLDLVSASYSPKGMVELVEAELAPKSGASGNENAASPASAPAMNESAAPAMNESAGASAANASAETPAANAPAAMNESPAAGANSTMNATAQNASG